MSLTHSQLLMILIGLEIDIFSQEAGTLGAGTFSSLADISVSLNIASAGGQTNLATYEDIYSLDQMISNLGTMKTLIDTKVSELTSLGDGAEDCSN